MVFKSNRPLALRGHVNNGSFKQWVGILLMPKIDRAHKNYLTPEIWEEKHLREIFYGTLVFEQSSMICIGCDIGGHTHALQHGDQTTFCLHLVKLLIVTLRCAVNVATSFFQHFPWSLTAKFVFRKEVIRNFQNHILVTWPATNFLILRQWCRFENPNHFYFV